MRVNVVIQALFDDGELAWGYAHEENIVGEKAQIDPEELLEAFRDNRKIPETSQEELDRVNRLAMADTLEKLLDQLTLARESILSQAATEMIDGGDHPDRDS